MVGIRKALSKWGQQQVVFLDYQNWLQHTDKDHPFFEEEGKMVYWIDGSTNLIQGTVFPIFKPEDYPYARKVFSKKHEGEAFNVFLAVTGLFFSSQTLA